MEHPGAWENAVDIEMTFVPDPKLVPVIRAVAARTRAPGAPFDERLSEATHRLITAVLPYASQDTTLRCLFRAFDGQVRVQVRVPEFNNGDARPQETHTDLLQRLATVADTDAVDVDIDGGDLVVEKLVARHN